MSADDKVTADARELAERVLVSALNHPEYWEDDEKRIAAVLAPVVARLSEAEKEASEVSHVAAQALARAEAAERALTASDAALTWLGAAVQEGAPDCGDDAATIARRTYQERDQLRAEIIRLERNLYTGDDEEKQALRAQLAAAAEDKERAENHLRGVLETTSAEREQDRIDAARFRLLSTRCEEMDDDPEGYFFALPINGSSPDVFERFVAAIDAARREGGAR